MDYIGYECCTWPKLCEIGPHSACHTNKVCVCAREKKRTLKHLKTTHFRPPANNTRPIEIDRVGSLCCWDFGSNTLRMKPHLRC